MRGLKLCIRRPTRPPEVVAPYVGAWVETLTRKKSPKWFAVAPYVGAWVETKNKFGLNFNLDVAPYVGAWVET